MRLDADGARAAIERARRRAARARRARGGGRGCLDARHRAHGRARSRRSRSTRASTRATAVLVGGGGAAGPQRGRDRPAARLLAGDRPGGRRRALGAAGALISDLTADFAATLPTTDRRLRRRRRRTHVLARPRGALRRRSPPGRARGASRRDRALGRGALPAPDLGARGAAARERIRRRDDVAQLRGLPRRPPARSSPSADPASEIELVRLARAGRAASLAPERARPPRAGVHRASAPRHGDVYFPGAGTSTRVSVCVRRARARSASSSPGPAIVESPSRPSSSTRARRSSGLRRGSLAIVPAAGTACPRPSGRRRDG